MLAILEGLSSFAMARRKDLSMLEALASAGSYIREPRRRRAFETPRCASSVDIAGSAGLKAPDLGADQLDQKRVSASPFDHDGERVVGDVPSVGFHGLPDRPLDFLAPDHSQMVPVCPPKKREHLIVHHVADCRAQPGRREGKFSFLSECVLDGRGELPKLADLVVVDLVERYEDAGPVFGKEVREQPNLATEAGLGDVGFRGAPRRRSRAEGARNTGEATANCPRVEVVESLEFFRVFPITRHRTPRRGPWRHRTGESSSVSCECVERVSTDLVVRASCAEIAHGSRTGADSGSEELLTVRS
jgi:hypothetical protein